MENKELKSGFAAGESRAESFFAKSVELFGVSSQKSNVFIKKRFRVANLLLELQFADDDFARVISRPFGHLETAETTEPNFVIKVFSGNINGVGPADFFGELDTKELGGPSDIEMNPIYSYMGDPIQGLYEVGAGVLSLLDRPRKLGVYWIDEASNLPFYVAASPLRNMFQWLLEDMGIQILHGGAVGLEQGGIVFAGKSGSGKSTSSLVSILDTRLKYLGDDFVLLKCDPSPTLYSLYNSGKLEPANLLRFSEFDPYIHNKEKLGNEKAVVYLDGEWADKLIRQFPLKAILIPKISDRKTSQIYPATPMESFKAIAPSTIFLFSSSPRRAFDELSRLVRLVPGFYLELGSDMSNIPELIFDLIRHSPLDQEVNAPRTDASNLG